MSLIDVETSAEAIQEDEELIEAVEQLVETAAVSLYTEIMNEVNAILTRFDTTIKILFPILVYWREDRTLFWEDLQKLAVGLVIFVIAFIVLSPSYTKRSKRSRSWLSFVRLTRAASLDSIQFNYFRSSPVSAKDGITINAHQLSNKGDRRHSIGWINQSSSLATGCIQITEEEESEEEKFAKTWPTIYASAGYSRLVLPPSCKLVEKPKHASKKEDKNQSALKSVEVAKDNKGQHRPPHKHPYNDDDHPANRLVNYMRHFVYLIVKFLRYDYVGAGWTLIHWIQACLRTRQRKEADEEDDDDDESSVASSRTSMTSLKGNNTSTSSNIPPSPPRSGLRSKRDVSAGERNLYADVGSAKTSPPNEGLCPNLALENRKSHEEDDSISNTTNCTLESTVADDVEEEKKESPSDNDDTNLNTPPRVPLHEGSLKRDNSVSSDFGTPRQECVREASSSSIYYDPPRLDTHELDAGERLATRLALHARAPTAPKTKDALEVRLKYSQ